jgi:hypothetical protein
MLVAPAARAWSPTSPTAVPWLVPAALPVAGVALLPRAGETAALSRRQRADV